MYAVGMTNQLFPEATPVACDYRAITPLTLPFDLDPTAGGAWIGTCIAEKVRQAWLASAELRGAWILPAVLRECPELIEALKDDPTRIEVSSRSV